MKPNEPVADAREEPATNGSGSVRLGELLPPRRSHSGRALLPRGPFEVITWSLVLLFLILAIFGPWLTRFDPNELNVGTSLSPPSSHLWFGADELGRDEFSRVVAAARVGVLAALESIGIALIIGGILGVIAGLVGSFFDGLLQRFNDLIFAFPEFLLAILVIAILGPGLFHATLAIGIVYVPRFARIARGATISIRGMAYIEAARLSGRSWLSIVFRHIIPNISTPMVVLTALSMSTAQLAYASLSFLGFGVRPPGSDYGQMLAKAADYMTTDPWMVVFPASALVLLVVTFNLLGDVVRDRLDPRGAVVKSI